VLQTKTRLAAVSSQLDSEFAPVLAFMQATRRAALLKLALPAQPTDLSVPVLQFDNARVLQQPLTSDEGDVNAELQMLQRLQPYFELAQDTQPHLVGVYYLSEQGFAYNGLPKWSDYIVDQLVHWHSNNVPEPGYERGQVFYAEFLPQQAAVMLPLYFADKKLGRFVFAIALEPLLAPMYQQHINSEFMLLDQSGQVISSSTSRAVQSINEHMLQIQRLDTMPWSLALLEQKTSLFAAGVSEFLWNWLTYAAMLGLLLAAIQFRYRRRTLSPANRLLIHIERLANGQLQGVRHVPQGWSEVFERISQLAQRNSASK
jgi:HAMP domain-containing protein